MTDKVIPIIRANKELFFQAEEYQCVCMCLDDEYVPTHDADGNALSLWGRIQEYANGVRQAREKRIEELEKGKDQWALKLVEIAHKLEDL